MPTPKTDGAPMELNQGANRMGTAIPLFSESIALFQRLFKEQYSLHESYKKGIFTAALVWDGRKATMHFSPSTWRYSPNEWGSPHPALRHYCVILPTPHLHIGPEFSHKLTGQNFFTVRIPLKSENMIFWYMGLAHSEVPSLKCLQHNKESYAFIARFHRLAHILAAWKQF